ncbi:MAG TPA: hypothetical protein VGK23_06295 [Methanomassiliicoccales archaeon]|jgi:uncharacterized integral membrane protein
MAGEILRSIVDAGESETQSHMEFMRKSIVMDLLFTTLIIVVVSANMLTAVDMGVPLDNISLVLFLNPPPMLFIALSISALVELYMLRKLRRSLRELSEVRSNGAVPGQTRKSMTDINYGMVEAMQKSLRIWPVIAILFVIYFIGVAENVTELTLGITYWSINWIAVLNMFTASMAVLFFSIQTLRWRTRRGKLRKLRRMEMTILEELHI